jgi:hypothetical protein
VRLELLGIPVGEGRPPRNGANAKEHDMTSTTGTTTTTSTRRASKRGTSHITSLEAVRATAGEPTTDCGVEYLDPAGLLVDVNVRQNPRVDKDLIASIRDHGVPSR